MISRARLLLAGSLSFQEEDFQVPKDLQESCLSSMRPDHVYSEIKDDMLILRFGEILLRKLGSRRAPDISQRLRQLARLKLVLNLNKPEKKYLSYFICGKGFGEVCETVKSLAGFHRSKENLNAFELPSLALRIGHNLVKCADMKRGMAIRQNDEAMKQDSNDYLDLHISEWTCTLSSVALATLRLNKFNKPTALPLTSDLILLKEYLDKKMEEYTAVLSSKADDDVWKKLAMVTIARLIHFNKRRSSEVAKLLLETYQQRPDWRKSVSDEIMATLKPVELKLLER